MATTNSPIRSRSRVYSDLDIQFRVNPNTNDIVRKFDLDAIKQSVTNIIRTRPGEKPFNPLFGCNLSAYLFELVTPQVLAAMRTQVRIALENFEPRIELRSVNVVDKSDENAVSITVDYRVKSPEGQIDTVDIVVERLR